MKGKLWDRVLENITIMDSECGCCDETVITLEDLEKIIEEVKKECPLEKKQVLDFPYGNFKPIGTKTWFKMGKNVDDIIKWVVEWLGEFDE